MADKKRKKRTADERSDDTKHRPEFPDEEYAAGEPERIRELHRAQRPLPHDPDEFVTDAEMEIREADSAPEDEDDV